MPFMSLQQDAAGPKPIMAGALWAAERALNAFWPSGRTALLNLKQYCANLGTFEIRILASSIEKQLVLHAFMQI
jgi:hypothetical protein